MSDDNGGRRRVDNTRFKWIVIASLIALAMVLGTIQEVMK